MPTANCHSSESLFNSCLLYTSDAADERSSVDLGGRRIIKKKKRLELLHTMLHITHIISMHDKYIFKKTLR